MSAPAKRHHRYTYDEYLGHEEASNVKHEFLGGEIYAMAGGSRQHAALAVAVSSALHVQLRDRPCVVHSSDLKIRVMSTGLATYPDVTVICGPAQEDTKGPHVVLNPTVVVEVTSPSSEEWDRGEKLEHYKQIPSLRAYLLVSHRQRSLELFERDDAASPWAQTLVGTGQSLSIRSLTCMLEVDGVYRNVNLQT